MPFESKAQQRFMFAKHPEMAKEWADKTPDISALPEHVKKMADGGTTAGSPADLDPGVQDASVSDFLLPYMLGPASMEAGAELPAALKDLGETGEVSLGKAAPAMEETANPDEVTAFVKGIQKGAPGSEGVKIYGVKGSPDKLKELFGDEAPGSVPENVLREKGILPPQVNIPQNAPNPYSDGGIVDNAKKVKSDSQAADNIDPVIPAGSTDTPKGYEKGGPVLRSSLEHPTPNEMMARAMCEGGYAEGGYPHVTFMEDQTPEGVKETTHLEKSHEEPKMAKGGFLEGLKKGALHKEMGISEDKNIPTKKLEHAANSDNETLRKRAQFAINAKKWHHAEGGVIPKENMSHEDKMSAIYKAMGIKKYADGGEVDNSSPQPSGTPNPSDPGFWDQIKDALSQVGSSTQNALGLGGGNSAAVSPQATNPNLTAAIQAGLTGGTNAAVAPLNPTAMPAEAALPSPDTLNTLGLGRLPQNASTTPPPAAMPISPAPTAPIAPPPTHIAPAENNTTTGMPNIGSIFNQDTSALTAGSNPEDRQALVNKLNDQQHGLGAIIAQAVSGLGDALAAKGHVEQHSLQGIFAMQKDQRQEALANFDAQRQARIQKLALQTQMGNNALNQAAAADAYGVDEHLNSLLGAPKGTMKKDLPTYMGMMSAQIAAKEKDEDLYMKSHAQASTDVDNAIKNSSILGIKPSPAQLQASGSKLADQYYNRAKGNVLVKPSDGGGAQWIPAQNIGKARQMDPNLQIVQ